MFACIYSTYPSVGVSLVDLAIEFSPLVEQTSPEIVTIDIEGCGRLYGPPGEIADRIARRASEAGLNANVALAGNPDAAIHAAKGLAGITVIEAGKESEYLGSLPLEVLYPPLAKIEDSSAKEIIETLNLWGIHTFSDFASLPETGVSERLGAEGVRLQRLARSTGRRSLVIAKPAQGFERTYELDTPVDSIESLSFLFGHLLGQLDLDLVARGLATNELRLRLMLEDRTVYERTISLPYPMRHPKTFLKLVQLDIESNPPHGAVAAVTISVVPVKPRTMQDGLFVPLAPEPARLEVTVFRIAKLVGSDRIGSPVILDTHRPGAFCIKRFQVLKRLDHTKKWLREEGPGCRLGFRAFRPPLPAKVAAPMGHPDSVATIDSESSASGPELKNTRRGRSNSNSCRLKSGVFGRVVRAAGPWHTTGDWWRQDDWAREEWDVAIATSRVHSGPTDYFSPTSVYRIYRDVETNSWFVEGMYD